MSNDRSKFVFDQQAADLEILGREGIQRMDAERELELQQDIGSNKNVQYFMNRPVKIYLNGGNSVRGWIKNIDYQGLSIMVEEKPDVVNGRRAFIFWDSIAVIEESDVRVKAKTCVAKDQARSVEEYAQQLACQGGCCGGEPISGE